MPTLGVKKGKRVYIGKLDKYVYFICTILYITFLFLKRLAGLAIRVYVYCLQGFSGANPLANPCHPCQPVFFASKACYTTIMSNKKSESAKLRVARDGGMSELGKKRWLGKTKAERYDHAQLMLKSRYSCLLAS